MAMHAVVYSVIAGDLAVTNQATGREIWRGRFGGAPVLKCVGLSDADDCIVLLDQRGEEPTRNIIRVTANGAVVWRASAPPVPGGYIDLRVENGSLLASSWSGYLIRLDTKTGATLERFVRSYDSATGGYANHQCHIHRRDEPGLLRPGPG